LNDLSFSRRQALGALSAGVATIALPGSARALAQGAAPSSEADVVALLDSIGENLLAVSPESATSLGIDIGARASYRARLSDRSRAGQDKVAATLRADLARAEAVNTASLSHSTRTSVEVVRSAYRVALDGFAQPYGDVAVGGWRNTPYVVIQNVGAYLDVPRFLDTDHRVENAQDAESYLARLESYPVQLEGELARLKHAGGKGLIAPAFLIDKAINQMTISVKNAREGGGLVESLERRTKDIPGDWAARARAITQQKVAPALERQLACGRARTDPNSINGRFAHRRRPK